MWGTYPKGPPDHMSKSSSPPLRLPLSPLLLSLHILSLILLRPPCSSPSSPPIRRSPLDLYHLPYLSRFISSSSPFLLHICPRLPSLAACMALSMPDSGMAQILTLLHASLAWSPPSSSFILAKRWQQTSLMPTDMTPCHLSRETIFPIMVAQ